MEKKPTVYESIKTMRKAEVATILFLFVKPIMDSLGFTEEQRTQMREIILSFLDSEIGAK